MDRSEEVRVAIEAARQVAHASIDQSFDALVRSFVPLDDSARHIQYNDPLEEHCRDPRNKNGSNLTPEGLEILFRLLDQGAGYNSAGRKMSITQTAVKNRKKDWEAAGGANRQKFFVSYLDTRT